MLQTHQIVDFIGPIGLLCVLITSLGEVRRLLKSPDSAQILMGGIFGFISMLEMNMPISPFEGIIIDLRNVSIVLAGAFLGWRGLACCLLVAISTRLYIGGAGMFAGCFGMLLAGYSGALWERITRTAFRRSYRQMLLLGAMPAISFLATLLMPHNAAIWFLQNAAPVLLLNYLIIIPAVAMLLQREILRIEAEIHMRQTSRVCPESGLLQPASFVRDTIGFALSSPPGTVGGLLVIEVDFPKWVGWLWGHNLATKINGAVAPVLTPMLTHAHHAGLTPSGRLAIPLTHSEVQNCKQLIDRISTQLAATSVSLPAGKAARFSTRVRVLPAENETELAHALKFMDTVGAGPRHPGQTQTSREARRSDLPVFATQPAPQHHLFAKLDAALESMRSISISSRD